MGITLWRKWVLDWQAFELGLGGCFLTIPSEWDRHCPVVVVPDGSLAPLYAFSTEPDNYLLH